MAVVGTGNASRKVMIIDLDNFENRKHEVAKQLHVAASEVGFVSLSLLKSQQLKHVGTLARKQVRKPRILTAADLQFYIRGHGIPQDLVDRAFEAGNAFLVRHFW